MPRTTNSAPNRPAFEPIYDTHPRTGVTFEVFYADTVLTLSFGLLGPGWCWWNCEGGALPDTPPTGPFATSYAAYWDATGDQTRFGDRSGG